MGLFVYVYIKGISKFKIHTHIYHRLCIPPSPVILFFHVQPYLLLFLFIIINEFFFSFILVFFLFIKTWYSRSVLFSGWMRLIANGSVVDRALEMRGENQSGCERLCVRPSYLFLFPSIHFITTTSLCSSAEAIKQTRGTRQKKRNLKTKIKEGKLKKCIKDNPPVKPRTKCMVISTFLSPCPSPCPRSDEFFFSFSR